MRHAIMHSWFIKLLNLACGDFHPCMSVCMLGLDVVVCQDGLECCPREEKLAKWSSEIEIALRDNHMSPGQASKLAGGLSWAAQNMFARYVYYYFIVHIHFSPFSLVWYAGSEGPCFVRCLHNNMAEELPCRSNCESH